MKGPGGRFHSPVSRIPGFKSVLFIPGIIYPDIPAAPPPKAFDGSLLFDIFMADLPSGPIFE
jgi:hypothetical protein